MALVLQSRKGQGEAGSLGCFGSAHSASKGSHDTVKPLALDKRAPALEEGRGRVYFCNFLVPVEVGRGLVDPLEIELQIIVRCYVGA